TKPIPVGTNEEEEEVFDEDDLSSDVSQIGKYSYWVKVNKFCMFFDRQRLYSRGFCVNKIFNCIIFV
ncbi:hypothetical protein, partial [Salmonella sp. SAL4355]|uniref:hypothetical protein n=1 Tax=Salmonella sp. SAL4355 TaxID=3159876 RepID=UPI00397B03A4